jgi:hypothetical protein
MLNRVVEMDLSSCDEGDDSVGGQPPEGLTFRRL